MNKPQAKEHIKTRRVYRVLRGLFFEDGHQLVQGGHLVPSGIDDGAAFLECWNGPAFVFDVHPAIAVDLDDRGVHGLDVKPHTPAAAAARIASSTPITTDAPGAPSPAPP